MTAMQHSFRRRALSLVAMAVLSMSFAAAQGNTSAIGAPMQSVVCVVSPCYAQVVWTVLWQPPLLVRCKTQDLSSASR